MSRRICVDICYALIKLRPELEEKTLKVVMTCSAEDGPEWQKHIVNKKQRRDLANQLIHPPPLGGFALRASCRQFAPVCIEGSMWVYLRFATVVSSPTSGLGSRTRKTPSRSSS
jgi:hypothetical protein